jgi:hypothetical protein
MLVLPFFAVALHSPSVRPPLSPSTAASRRACTVLLAQRDASASVTNRQAEARGDGAEWAAAGVVASVASVIASTSEARSVADETSFTAASSAVRRSAIISGLEHGGPRGARVAAKKPERERGGVAKRRWRAGPGESSEELEAARALRVVECDGDDGAESTSVRIESGVPRGVHCGVCSPAAPPPAPPAPAPPWGKEGLVRKEETEEPNE